MSQKSLPEVSKVKALEILQAIGSIDAEGFGEALAEAGFGGAGEGRARFRAHRILTRFHAQGLVERKDEQRMVQYSLLGLRDLPKPVERKQRVFYWRLTEKGVQRMEWLRIHAQPSGEPSRGKKRPK